MLNIKNKEIKIYISNELFENLKVQLHKEDTTCSEYIRNLIKKDLKRKHLKEITSFNDKDVVWIFYD